MVAVPHFRRLRLQAGLVFILFAPCRVALADSAWLTRVWHTDDGLPNQSVTALAQTRDGYIWVATMTGLARFDGSRFAPLSFGSLDGDRIRREGVGGLLVDGEGGLWISCIPGSIAYLSPDGSRLSRCDTGVPATVLPLAATEEKNGAVWIGFAGGAVVRINRGKSVRFTGRDGVPASGTIYSLACDADGTVWMTKGSEAVYFRGGRFHELTALSGEVRPGNKLRLTACRGGGVWIVNQRGELFKCDQQRVLQDCGSALADSPNATAETIMEDHAGAVWIGTDMAGLFRYTGAGFERIDTSYPGITCLMEARDHTVWAGTAGGGLDRITPRGVQLEAFGGPFPVGARSVAEDTTGALWAVTQRGQVLIQRGEGWISPFDRSLGVATCVAPDPGGGVFIGTREGAVYAWRDGQFKIWDSGDLGGGVISTLLPTSKGDLWVGKYTGRSLLECLHEGKWRSVATPAGVDRILTMAEDKAGNIWIGSRAGGLARAEGDHFVDETPRTSLSGWPIRTLYADADGALWIAYGGAGLGRIKDGRFAHLGTASGLPSNYISQIVADDRGWFWFGRDRGIFKIRREELEEALAGRPVRLHPVYYGRNEGLGEMQADYGASHGALRSRDGRVWLPMRTALVVADPKILSEDPGPPRVLLTKVMVDDRPAAAYDAAASDLSAADLNFNSQSGPLRLAPGPHKLDFEFTALNFTEPENVHFRYRLDGVDSDWVDAGVERVAAYAHLEAGAYRFRVQARVGDGEWSEARVPFPITVNPFFWQTFWFRLVVLVLFTVGGAVLARYVSHRRLKQKLRLLEHQNALDKERARIARDLHDDLGGSLTQVALMLDMAQRAATDGHKARLDQCLSMVRQVATSVDEIIWAINPRNDTLPYLVDYLSQFVVEFLHAAGIRCRVDLPDRLPGRTVTPEMRHHIFLAVKESLNNIARHAGASEVRLRIAADDDRIAIVVEDDGCGFEAAPDNASADGLRNMRQRMSEIGGRFQIDTKRGAGTRVSFLYSWNAVE